MILKMFYLNAGEDVQKREPACTRGWNVNLYSLLENKMEIS